MNTDSDSHVEQIRRYQPLVRRLARQMIAKLPANEELDDLIQVGMIGLCEALSRFDANQGVQFETYAVERIRGAMLDELRGKDWMSRGDRRHQRSIEAAVHKLEQRFGRAPSEGEVAREMGLTLAAYQELLGRVRGTQLIYLEDMSGDDGDEDYLDRHVADEEADPVAQLEDWRMREALVTAIKQLPEREQHVMNLRYEQDMTFKEIGDILRVTESRVCQIHAQVVVRLRKKLGGWSERSAAPVALLPLLQDIAVQVTTRELPANGHLEPAPVSGHDQERLATTDREQRGWRVRTKFVKPTEQAERRGFTPLQLERWRSSMDKLLGKLSSKK